MPDWRNLTGRVRTRKGWYRTIVLEIEIRRMDGEVVWANAQEDDLWRIDAMIRNSGEIPTFALNPSSTPSE